MAECSNGFTVECGFTTTDFGDFHSEHSMPDNYDECIRIRRYSGINVDIYRGVKQTVRSETEYLLYCSRN